MNLILKKLSIEDAEALFTFETENKDFFEKSVPPRSDDYYEYDSFLRTLASLLEEQDKGDCCFYLIKNGAGSIVGRINVIDIDRSSGQGTLGYRIGASYTRKSIASKALNLLQEMLIREKTITQLSAKTTQDNLGSQKVLEKNGFKAVNEENESGLNFIHYSWAIKEDY